MRLFTKFLLAFVAVVLLAVGIVAVLANRAAQREVTGLMAGGHSDQARLAAELAGYYRGHGGWDGVQSVLRAPQPMRQMMGPRLVLADASGRVVADSGTGLIGSSLPASDLAAGQPVLVDGQQVGSLLAYSPRGQHMAADNTVLERVDRAMWLAALGGGAAAVLVGALMAYSLLRPVRALTAASGALARGKLSERVNEGGSDEIGDLARAFNAMAAALQQAERQRQDMTADIAHELRNPIAVLQGSLEAVVDGVLPPTSENLQPLVAQTQLLARLVDDLRTLALADAGRLSLERSPTDPAELARAALAHMRPQAEAKGIDLQAELAAGLPRVALDPQRIAQVLGNLLSNAVRHTPPGGRIRLRLQVQAGRGLVFSVADSGPGISPEALPHIFERFYRVDSARSRAEGGTGLGLSIARQLVRAHGGEIWAANQPGQGAEISFSLPLAS
jgi:signal transduction histidine kinase